MQNLRSVLLINDNSAHLNWGAQASPPALSKILAEALPGSTISALTHDWLRRPYRRMPGPFKGRLVRGDGWPGFQLFLNRCSVPTSLYPEIADDFDYWADEWMAGRGGPQGREFLQLAEAADLVVYNGENSIYRNTIEGCHAIFLLWLTKTRLGKPSCIVNHTAYLTEERPIMSGMVRLTFPKLDLVAVREPASLATLQNLGVENAELYPDVAFAHEPSRFSRRRVDEWRRQHGLGDQTYFCLSASGLPVSMPRDSWDGEVTALVRDLRTVGLQAVLMAKDPWCLPLEEVARRTGSVFFGPEHEYHDLWPLLEGAAFLVSGHYHYVIFAAMMGCPFIPLSVNNHKMRGVCEHLGWKRTAPFDATFLRACRSEIVSEACRLRENRAALSGHLLERSAALHEEACRLGSRIAEVATRTDCRRGAAGGAGR